MFKSSNPVLSRMDNTENTVVLEGKPMTVSGTIGKVFALLMIASVSGAAVIYEAMMGYADKVLVILGAALIVGLITGLVTAFVPKLAKFLSPVYAFAEGALLAGISLIAETQFPGIALQAVSATFVAFFVVLFLYKTGAVRATEKFRSTIISALTTILIVYLVEFIGSFFNFHIPFLRPLHWEDTLLQKNLLYRPDSQGLKKTKLLKNSSARSEFGISETKPSRNFRAVSFSAHFLPAHLFKTLKLFSLTNPPITWI